MSRPLRITVGISGANGILYGVRLLQVLRETHIETHLVVTKAAEMTRAYETFCPPSNCAVWRMCGIP